MHREWSNSLHEAAFRVFDTNVIVAATRFRKRASFPAFFIALSGQAHVSITLVLEYTAGPPWGRREAYCSFRAAAIGARGNVLPEPMPAHRLAEDRPRRCGMDDAGLRGLTSPLAKLVLATSRRLTIHFPTHPLEKGGPPIKPRNVEHGTQSGGVETVSSKHIE